MLTGPDPSAGSTPPLRRVRPRRRVPGRQDAAHAAIWLAGCQLRCGARDQFDIVTRAGERLSELE